MEPPEETTLDREQLMSVSLGDPGISYDLLLTLIEDSARNAGRLEAAIRDRQPQAVARLAHYSKGACANLGARAAAAALEQIENAAKRNTLDGCGASLAALQRQLELLRREAPGLRPSDG